MPADWKPPSALASVCAQGRYENFKVMPVTASVRKLTMTMMCSVRLSRLKRRNCFCPTACFRSCRLCLSAWKLRGSQSSVWMPKTVNVPSSNAVMNSHV